MDVLQKGCIKDPPKFMDDRDSLVPSQRDWSSAECKNRVYPFSFNHKEQKRNRVGDEGSCISKNEVIPQFPNSSDLLGLIKSCGKQRDLLKGRKLHADVVRTGLITQDIYVGTALLSMYAKCGVLSKAQQLFDELLSHDVASWNALITGYAQQGHGDAALLCYKEMRDEGLFPDSVTFVCVLKACSSIGATQQGEELHVEARRHGLLKNNIVLCTTLVHMYAKCGAMAKAKEVFDELGLRDVALWTALIAGYAQHGLGEEALKCFTQMKKEGFTPNVVTFVCTLKACAQVGAIEKGEEIYTEAKRQGLLQKNLMLGTALVDMYAKCGELGKAREVFDELPTRDVALWNALIAAYAQHEISAEAWTCFELMRNEGLSPNAVTYTCLLKACTDIDKGEEIHSEVSRQGFLGENIVLSTALVDMYARCGLLGKAQEVFDNIPVRDAALWNALMVVYAQHGLANETLYCLGQMEREGLSPNAMTFVCALKACGCLGAIEKGEEIHLKVERQGLLEGNTMLGNALVDMYMKCGALAKAHNLFEELPNRDVSSWNVLISGYVQQGLSNEAVCCFEQMQVSGLDPDTITFVCVLKACGSVEAIKLGEEIHAEVNRQGLLGRHVVLGTALVDMYAKCGALAKAQQLFDELPARDVASWTALMVGYAQQGLNDEALRCFEQMQREGFSPSAFTFACILKVCGSLRAVGKGEEIHAEVKRQELLEKHVVLGNALVDMYAKCGSLEKAKEVFDELPARDVASWNAMIAGYVEQGLADEALKFYRRMQFQDLSPDAITYVHVLKACGSIGAAEKGEEIYFEVDRLGLLERHLGLGTAFVDMYAKCGELAKAQEVFDKILEHDVISWTALISGYALHGFGDEALKCYEQMRDEGFFPDATTFACILKACGSMGSLEKGKMIHDEVRKQGNMGNHLVLGNALVDMYAKCGALAKAQEVFDKSLHRDVISWTALMAGYSQVGQVGSVVNLFNRMIAECVEPNIVTFVVLLTACSHTGLVDDGRGFFTAMSTSYNIVPSVEHHNCIVDLLSRAGHFEEAVSVIKKVPPPDCGFLFSALLAGCQTWTNVNLGGWAFEFAVQSDEHPAAAYVGMSNIYAAACIQEDFMNGRGIEE